MFLLAFHFNILKQTSATMFFYMCESKAAATNVFARKRSVSGKCLLRENEVSAATDLQSRHCYKFFPFDYGE
ncbi:hypothetical protein [Lysinibacillus sp. TE18511]|jgi:hypothetical protein